MNKCFYKYGEHTKCKIKIKAYRYNMTFVYNETKQINSKNMLPPLKPTWKIMDIWYLRARLPLWQFFHVAILKLGAKYNYFSSNI